jgi:hypothetical protein
LVIACGIGVQTYFTLSSMMVNFQVATSTSTDFLIRLSAALWDKSFTLGGIQNPLRIHLNTSLPGRREASAVQAKFKRRQIVKDS